MDWTPAFARETNLRFGFFSSFRRKPESSSIKDEIRCLHDYGLINLFVNYLFFVDEVRFFSLLLSLINSLKEKPAVKYIGKDTLSNIFDSRSIG